MDDFENNDMNFDDGEFADDDYCEEPFDNELDETADPGADNDSGDCSDITQCKHDALYWGTLGYGFGYYDGEGVREGRRKRKKSDDDLL